MEYFKDRLYEIFESFSSFGDRGSASATIDGTKFAKLCRDCGRELMPRFSLQCVTMAGPLLEPNRGFVKNTRRGGSHTSYAPRPIPAN